MVTHSVQEYKAQLKSNVAWVQPFSKTNAQSKNISSIFFYCIWNITNVLSIIGIRGFQSKDVTSRRNVLQSPCSIRPISLANLLGVLILLLA
jgi:hypothetical protein